MEERETHKQAYENDIAIQYYIANLLSIVPQGSVLSPVLLLLINNPYFNQMHLC